MTFKVFLIDKDDAELSTGGSLSLTATFSRNFRTWIDLNNVDQQRSEYQRLQAEADMKPVAKTTKSNEDGDQKRPAKEATASSAEAAPSPNDIDDNTETAASAWLRSNMIHINGEFQFRDPDQVVPQYVHDWTAHTRDQIGRMRQETQLAPPAASDATEDEYNLAQIASLKAAVRKVKRIQQQLPAQRKSPAKKAKPNDDGEKLDAQKNPPNVDSESEPDSAPMRFPANHAADNWLASNNATPQLNGEILVEGPIQIPTFVQQHVQEWADYALSLATPFEEPPPDATDKERREAVETWALFHRLQEADGTIYILHPNRAIQEAPQWIQDWMTTHPLREPPSPTSSTI